MATEDALTAHFMKNDAHQTPRSPPAATSARGASPRRRRGWRLCENFDVRAESSRRPPRHGPGAVGMAMPLALLDTLIDFHTGRRTRARGRRLAQKQRRPRDGRPPSVLWRRRGRKTSCSTTPAKEKHVCVLLKERIV